jgi:membrane associated rhomboid family serine protease
MEKAATRKANLRNMPMVPPGIRFLLVANALFFLATIVAKGLLDLSLIKYLGLYHPTSDNFSYYQFASHLFMHGSGLHIFLNMFVLWMFGGVLEHVWGRGKFLFYFFLTGLGAALLHNGVRTIQINQLQETTQQYLEDPSYKSFKKFKEDQMGALPRDFRQRVISLKNKWKNNPDNSSLKNQSKKVVKDYRELYIGMPTVGASGAVYGVLMAFGLLFPNLYVYLYLLIPIRAKYFVFILIALQLYLGFFNKTSNVANFAHLGGMLFGFILLKLWDEKPIQLVKE